MGNIRKIQFRPHSRGPDKLPIPGTCGRPAERECGMKDSRECSTHAPLQPNPDADKARSRARAIRAVISAGFDYAPTQ